MGVPVQSKRCTLERAATLARRYTDHLCACARTQTQALDQPKEAGNSSCSSAPACWSCQAYATAATAAHLRAGLVKLMQQQLQQRTCVLALSSLCNSSCSSAPACWPCQAYATAAAEAHLRAGLVKLMQQQLQQRTCVLVSSSLCYSSCSSAPACWSCQAYATAAAAAHLRAGLVKFMQAAFELVGLVPQFQALLTQ